MEAAAGRSTPPALLARGRAGSRKERREAAAKRVYGTGTGACSAYAIATREPYGTWGGLSENDRREHVRRSDPRADLLRYRTALAAWRPANSPVAVFWTVGCRPTPSS